MHDLPKLANVTTIFASFDLWMFKGGIETFLLLLIISLKLGEPMHVIVGLFEVNKTIGLCMA